MKRFILYIILFFMGIYFSSPVTAATINVSPGQSIQNSIDSARPGDEIIVMPGTYAKNWINLNKGNIILRCSQKWACSTGSIETNSDSNTVKWFNISDKSAEAGIRTTGDNNLILENNIHNMKQDGIWFFGSYNIFRGNYIHDILDPSIQGDPHVDCFQTWDWNWNTVGVIFEDNICDHTRDHDSNQIFMIQGSKLKNLTIQNNRFVMHDSGYSPIALWGGSGFTIKNNYICNTSGQGDEAVYLDGANGATISGNTFTGYTNLMRGSAVNSGNIRGSLPCAVFPDESLTPLPTEKPTDLHTPAPTINLQKPGDANGDGRVDGVDYIVWLNHYNQSFLGPTNGDFDNNGIVDGVDYMAWLKNYGK